MSDMQHLSVVDGAFLHLESPEMPMHVGSLALFDPPPGGAEGWYEAVKAHVVGRMHLAPVFTRKLALMPFDLANPVWIHDDDIDIDYHMRYLVLPKPGTMAQMEALCARLHSSLLDRSRPLWEFYVIEGLADGRLGFYSKVHHSAVDGQAAVAMANSVFDLTPEPRRVKPPRAVRSNRYQLGVAELLGAALSNQLQQVLQFAKLLPPLAGAAIDAFKAKYGIDVNELDPNAGSGDELEAIRANKDNMAYFESKRSELEALNLKRREEAAAERAKERAKLAERGDAVPAELLGECLGETPHTMLGHRDMGAAPVAHDRVQRRRLRGGHLAGEFHRQQAGQQGHRHHEADQGDRNQHQQGRTDEIAHPVHFKRGAGGDYDQDEG